MMLSCVFFFFKRETSYEMRISDWSSDVCSSDLDNFPRVTVAVSREQVRRSKRTAAAERYRAEAGVSRAQAEGLERRIERDVTLARIGRASCRERVCQYV